MTKLSASFGDPEKQGAAFFSRRLIYCDETTTCKNCGKSFVVSADHLKHLIEDLGRHPKISIEICPDCRKNNVK